MQGRRVLPFAAHPIRGIHETSVAGVKLAEENAELIKTLNALGNHPMKLPEVVERQEVVKMSNIKKTNGGYLNINDDCWKPMCVDEHTGEVLQDNLMTL